MRVNLAAEVLSASVAAILRSFSPPDTSRTATLCEMVDSFFDCLNISSTSEHQRKRKPFLARYSSLHDERFHWLETTKLNLFITDTPGTMCQINIVGYVPFPVGNYTNIDQSVIKNQSLPKLLFVFALFHCPFGPIWFGSIQLYFSGLNARDPHYFHL